MNWSLVGAILHVWQLDQVCKLVLLISSIFLLICYFWLVLPAIEKDILMPFTMIIDLYIAPFSVRFFVLII